jgi:predicted amidohydrolase
VKVSVPREELRIRVEQTAPRRGEVEANAWRIGERMAAARSDGSDLVVFPELALTGYALGEGTRDHARPVAEGGDSPIPLPEGVPAVVMGLVELAPDRRLFNTAVALRDGRVLHRHRKIHLPTYGMFQEGRYFAPGREPPGYVDLFPGWRVGILICEDFWHPALSYLLALQGIDLLLVLAAAPGREVPARGGQDRFGSSERWEVLARATALSHGIYVVLANRAGTEDGATFAGGSLVVDPWGSVLERAPDAREGTLTLTLHRQAITAARTPYHHLRDEDPALVLRALQARVEGGR